MSCESNVSGWMMADDVMTAEILYEEYRKLALFKRKGVYPRPMKDFAKARANAGWPHYEQLAKLVNDNAGHLDHRIYLEALVDFFDGYVPDKLLATQKAIRIYKNYVARKNLERDNVKAIELGVIRSIKNVATYMSSKGMTTLDEYVSADAHVIPPLARHYSAGSVTKHFLALVPRLDLMLNQYPQDIVTEYFGDLLGREYEQLRVSMLRHDKLRRIGDNVERLIIATIEGLKHK